MPGNICPPLGAAILPWHCSSPGAFPAPFPRNSTPCAHRRTSRAQCPRADPAGLAPGCSCTLCSQHGVSLPGPCPRGSFCRISPPYSSFLLELALGRLNVCVSRQSCTSCFRPEISPHTHFKCGTRKSCGPCDYFLPHSLFCICHFYHRSSLFNPFSSSIPQFSSLVFCGFFFFLPFLPPGFPSRTQACSCFVWLYFFSLFPFSTPCTSNL